MQLGMALSLVLGWPREAMASGWGRFTLQPPQSRESWGKQLAGGGAGDGCGSRSLWTALVEAWPTICFGGYSDKYSLQCLSWYSRYSYSPYMNWLHPGWHFREDLMPRHPSSQAQCSHVHRSEERKLHFAGAEIGGSRWLGTAHPAALWLVAGLWYWRVAFGHNSENICGISSRSNTEIMWIALQIKTPNKKCILPTSGRKKQFPSLWSG